MEAQHPLAVNRYRDARAGQLRPADVGRTVRLAGWIAAKRDHGGLLFVDLRDPAGPSPAGSVQLGGHPDLESFSLLAGLRLESVISVVGTVVARTEANFNPKIDTGAIEVQI